jgi:DNA-binding response OmpR family regulator
MSRKRLLIVEDDPDVAELLLVYFGAYQYDVFHAELGRDGINLARAHFPHLILLDLMLPDIDGYDVCRNLRATSLTRYIPIIFLTQRDERANRVKGLELGADDYVTKPFNVDELRLRVQGSISRATRESLHEPRSGLPTGSLVAEEIATRTRTNDPHHKLIFRLDNFKAYSDVYGFMAADEVFGFAAQTIQRAIRAHGTPDDFVGVRSDHFVVLTHATDPAPLIAQARAEFQQSIQPFYHFQDVEQGGLVLDVGTDSEQIIPLMDFRVEA